MDKKAKFKWNPRAKTWMVARKKKAKKAKKTNWRAVWRDFDDHPMTPNIGQDSKRLLYKLIRKHTK